MPSKISVDQIAHSNETNALEIDTSGNVTIQQDLKFAGNVTLKDSAGNNVISESAGVVTVNADAAVISGSSTGDLVRITQTGTGNALKVEDETNPDSTPFVVDASGNVGIGTSSINKSGSYQALTLNVPSGQYGAIELATGDTGRWYINADSTTVYDIAMNNTNRVFYTGGSERMRIDSSGNVGINEATPIAQLHVRSSGSPNPAIFVTNTNADITWGVADNFQMGEWDGTTFTERMRIDTNGKTQLGTISNTNGVAGTGVKIKSNAIGSVTEYALDIEGTGGDFYAMQTSSNGIGILSVSSGSLGYWLFRHATQGVIATFYEDGQIFFPGSYGDSLTGTYRDLYIRNDGKLGYVASIRDAKINISNLESVNWLYSLNPVYFQYRTKDEEDNYTDTAEDQIEYGLIAEEVETVNSDLVFYDETENGLELRGVQYSRLIAPLIKAVQQQKALIESQQSQIDSLTARIEALEAN